MPVNSVQVIVVRINIYTIINGSLVKELIHS